MKRIKSLITCTLLLSFLCFQTEFVTSQSNNQKAGYDKASYNGFKDGEFLKHWQVLGPVKIGDSKENPNDSIQKSVFEKDEFKVVKTKANKPLPTITIKNKKYSWELKSYDDGLVDFIKEYGSLEYAYAYALAEVKMDKAEKIVVGIGSDDAIKVFINGKLAHSNWIGRATVPDQDIVVFDLQKGSNQILVKVQNMAYGWSFTMRKLTKELMNQALLTAAANGDSQQVKFLTEHGGNINFVGKNGLNVYQTALVNGHDHLLTYLEKIGAKKDAPLPSLENYIENLFSEMEDGVKPGAAVLVSKNGKVIYKKGFGYADVGNKVKITPETKFKIASISKQFIASSILKLQEEGKISVKDKLSKFLPNFPKANKVTIYQLLTHTSGIFNFTNSQTLFYEFLVPISPENLIDTLKAYPYDFDPGEKYNYNNSAYFILGHIIEKISGKKLEQYLQENIFKPIGMKNTGLYNSTRILENEAYSFEYKDDKIEKAFKWDMSWAGGAGGIYSTVEDLFLWNESLFNGKVLSDSSLKAAFSPILLNNGQKLDYYGFGWGFSTYKGLRFISHSGGLPGVSTYLARQPDTKTTICILTNYTPHNIWPSAKAMMISDYLLWKKMKEIADQAPKVEVDIETQKSYVGKYDYGQGAILTVTLDGKQLYAQMTGQPKFPIFPSSENKFVWKVVEASITFTADKDGKVIGAVHKQGGQELKVSKLTDK